MIEKIAMRLGFCSLERRQRDVNDAYEMGRDTAEDELHRYYGNVIETLKLQHSCVDRELQHIREILASGISMRSPPPIIVTKNGSLDGD